MNEVSFGPEVVSAQAALLGRDITRLTAVADDQVRALVPEMSTVDKVYLVGNGDSYHAGCAAEMAFESIAGVACEPMSAQRFLHYGADAVHLDRGTAMVVVASASGETERVVQSLARAGELGLRTAAFTVTPGSTVTRRADHPLVITPPGLTRSPGVRTYQASLLGLMVLAARLGESRGRCDGDAVREEIGALAPVVEATNELNASLCRELAGRVAAAPMIMMTGSGPGHGTAMFAAAKMVETAGLFASAQDIEEWCHVERFARPTDMPVVIIAPPGRSSPRAETMAARAAKLGRTVIAVVADGDVTVAPHADVVLPVCGATREELAPLVYHLFACHLADQVARRLGRKPFEAGR